MPARGRPSKPWVTTTMPGQWGTMPTPLAGPPGPISKGPGYGGTNLNQPLTSPIKSAPPLTGGPMLGGPTTGGNMFRGDMTGMTGGGLTGGNMPAPSIGRALTTAPTPLGTIAGNMRRLLPMPVTGPVTTGPSLGVNPFLRMPQPTLNPFNRYPGTVGPGSWRPF